MHEEFGEHFDTRAHSQELGMRAKLGPVVRGRRGRCAQPIRSARKRRQQRGQRLCVVMLDDARLIQYNADEPLSVELVQTVIVDDVDSRPNIRWFAQDCNVDADCSAFFCHLLCDCQRRQNEHVAARMPMDSLGPCELHPRLSEPGVGEDCASAATQRPIHEHALVLEHWDVSPSFIRNSGGSDGSEFARQKIRVAHAGAPENTDGNVRCAMLPALRGGAAGGTYGRIG